MGLPPAAVSDKKSVLGPPPAHGPKPRKRAQSSMINASRAGPGLVADGEDVDDGDGVKAKPALPARSSRPPLDSVVADLPPNRAPSASPSASGVGAKRTPPPKGPKPVVAPGQRIGSRRRTVSERVVSSQAPAGADGGGGALVAEPRRGGVVGKDGKGPKPGAAMMIVVAVFTAEREFVDLLGAITEVLRGVFPAAPSDSPAGQVLARFDAIEAASTSLLRKLAANPATALSVVSMCTAFLGTMPRLYAYADFARNRAVMARFLATGLTPKENSDLRTYLDAKGLMLETLFAKPLSHFLLYPRLVHKLSQTALAASDASAVAELLGRLKDLKAIVQEQAGVSRSYARLADELDAIEPAPELDGVLTLGAKVVGAGEVVVHPLALDALIAAPSPPPKGKSFPARFCLLDDSLLILRRKKKARGSAIYSLHLRVSAATMSVVADVAHDADAVRVHDHRYLIELVFEDAERKSQFVSAADAAKIAFSSRHGHAPEPTSLLAPSSSPSLATRVPSIHIPVVPPTIPLPVTPLDPASTTRLLISIPPCSVHTTTSLDALTAYIAEIDVRIEALSLGNVVDLAQVPRPPLPPQSLVLDAYAARPVLASNARLDALLTDVAGSRIPSSVRDSMMISPTVDWTQLAPASVPPSRTATPPVPARPAPAPTTTPHRSPPPRPSFNATFAYSPAAVTNPLAHPTPLGPVALNPHTLSRDELLHAYLLLARRLAELEPSRSRSQ